MPGTPDTLQYMILGYAVGVGLMIVCIGALFIKRSRLNAEIRELEDLSK